MKLSSSKNVASPITALIIFSIVILTEIEERDRKLR